MTRCKQRKKEGAIGIGTVETVLQSEWIELLRVKRANRKECGRQQGPVGGVEDAEEQQ